MMKKNQIELIFFQTFDSQKYTVSTVPSSIFFFSQDFLILSVDNL